MFTGRMLRMEIVRDSQIISREFPKEPRQNPLGLRSGNRVGDGPLLREDRQDLAQQKGLPSEVVNDLDPATD